MINLMVHLGHEQDTAKNNSSARVTCDLISGAITDIYDHKKNVAHDQNNLGINGKNCPHPPLSSKTGCSNDSGLLTKCSLAECVLEALKANADSTGYGRITQATLARMLGVSQPAVSMAMRTLKRHGYIARQKGRQWYRLTPSKKSTRAERNFERLKGMIQSLDRHYLYEAYDFVSDLLCDMESMEGGVK
jgi:biotin operon repressor